MSELEPDTGGDADREIERVPSRVPGLDTILCGVGCAAGSTLDGVSAVEAMAGAVFEMKRFTHELQTLASATDCTMFLLTATSGASSALLLRGHARDKHADRRSRTD